MSLKLPIAKIVGISIAIPFIFIFGLVILVVVVFGGSSQQTGIGDTLAYAGYITEIAHEHNVPPIWALADIAWESNGNWRSTNENTNGTEDAGLCQINSDNWASYGLSDDPFNVLNNINAGETILGKNLALYNNDISSALYAYNGGTAANGMKYNPSYVPNVENEYNLLSASNMLVLIHSIEGNTFTLTVAVNYQSYFYNPTTIDVYDMRNDKLVSGPFVCLASAGDGVTFPPEATIYKINITTQKGDQLLLKTSVGNGIYESNIDIN